MNDAPVNTVPGAQTVNEDTNLVFSTANGNAITIADPDSGSNSLTVTLSVTNGTLTLSGTTGLTFTTGSGTADATMTFSGTASAIDTALDGLTYRGDQDFNGSDQLSIATDDGGNSGAGGAQSDSDTVLIGINAVNDAPAVTGSGGATGFTEGDAATAIDTALTLSDVDSSALTGATVTISSGLMAGDELAFADTADITGSYNSGTGVLT